MKQIPIFLLIIVSFTSAHSFTSSPDKCVYDTSVSQYLGGCYQDCLDFATFQEAKTYCNYEPGCGGITFSKVEYGGAQSTGKSGNGWGYQIREATSQNYSLKGETSWKKNNCDNNLTAFQRCDFKPAQGQYLSGCVLNCKRFSDKKEAIDACKKNSQCKGITFSKSGEKFYFYELRASSIPEVSKNGEDSWIKPQMCGF